jgi:hypothetical protein
VARHAGSGKLFCRSAGALAGPVATAATMDSQVLLFNEGGRDARAPAEELATNDISYSKKEDHPLITQITQTS